MTSGLPTVGMRAVLEGAAQYVRDAQQINQATSGVAQGVDRAAQQTRSATNGMRQDFTGLASVSGSLAGAFGVLLGPFSQLASQGREVADGLLLAAQSAGQHGLTGVLTGLVAAGVSAVAMFTALGISGAQWATGIQRITSITGLSQSQAELYGNALQLVGGDESALIRTSFLLERQLVSAAEAMKAGQSPATGLTRALDRLGIQWRDATGNARDMGQLLPEIIDRLGTLDDKQTAVALSTQIFGRYGVELTRIIENYGPVMGEATKLTDEFSTAEFDASVLALRYQSTLTRLGQAFQFLAVHALPPFLDLAEGVADAIASWVSVHGADFVDGLSRAIIAGTSAIGKFAEGFGSVLGPAIEYTAAGLSALGEALDAIPQPVIDAILRLAGGAAAIAILAIAVSALSSVVVGLTTSLFGLSVALLTTPAGWVALAAALTVAGIGYVYLKSRAEEAAAAQRETAEASRIAKERTLEENQANYQKAVAIRMAIAADLAMASAGGVVSDQTKDLQSRLETIETTIRIYQKAIGDAEKELGDLERATKGTNSALDDSQTVFEKMGLKAVKSADDLKKLSSEMIVAAILAENLRNMPEGTDPFDVVNSGAFRRQIDVVLGAYKEARREAEAAMKGNEILVNAAGYLTSAQQSAAEAAARAAQQASEEYARAVEKMVKDAADAAKRIRDAQVAELDQLGGLLSDALRARYSEQLRITLDSYSQQQQFIDSVYEERIDSATRASQAEIAAIDASTAAVVAGINAQIAALRGLNDAEDREQLVRKVALTYDAKEHDAAERELRQFDRRVQVNALQAQAQSVQAQARARKDAIESDLRDRLDAIEKEQDAVKKQFQFAEKAARDTYEKQTEEFTLQSEVRRLLMDKEQTGFVTDMIQKYAPQWQIAGISMGQQLLIGIRAQIEPYLRSLTNLIPYGGTRASGGSGSAYEQEQGGYVQALQAQGQAAAAGGAPAAALEQMRQTVIASGTTPSFDRGLDWGRVPKPMLATLHTGEVVLTPEQQERYMGGARYERGAFEGMFSGANFTGSPEENMREARRQFGRFMDDQTGRDAFLAGSGR